MIRDREPVPTRAAARPRSPIGSENAAARLLSQAAERSLSLVAGEAGQLEVPVYVVDVDERSPPSANASRALARSITRGGTARRSRQ